MKTAGYSPTAPTGLVSRGDWPSLEGRKGTVRSTPTEKGFCYYVDSQYIKLMFIPGGKECPMVYVSMEGLFELCCSEYRRSGSCL